MHFEGISSESGRRFGSRRARSHTRYAVAWFLCAGVLLIGTRAAVAEAAPARPLDVQTALKGLHFTSATELPAGPGAASHAEQCPGFTIEPVSAAGKRVQKLGWPVLSEAMLGRFRLVSFAGAFESGTSGSCMISRGNIAVFDGLQLRALAYAGTASDMSIGRLAPLEGGSVRVWSGDYPAMPTGDLRLLGDDRLQLGEVAAEESLCHGAVHVPNIFAMPIDKARQVLIAKGWAPATVKIAPSELFARERGFQQRGIVEVGGCAGTGYGFCTFRYRSAGARLSVVTAGDPDDGGGSLPPVIHYSAQCR